MNKDDAEMQGQQVQQIQQESHTSLLNSCKSCFTLNRYVPGTRADVFKTPIFERNIHLYQMVQNIPNELNRLMFKELKAVEHHPEVLYTRYAITVGEFATTKVLNIKSRRDRKKKTNNDDHSDESDLE